MQLGLGVEETDQVDVPVHPEFRLLQLKLTLTEDPGTGAGGITDNNDLQIVHLSERQVNRVPELRVEVVAGAVPTPLVEHCPEGFHVEGDTVARCDCLAHIVSREAVRKIELMIKPGFRGVVKRPGCQTKAGEGSEIVGFDPVHDSGAHFLGGGRRSVVHFPFKIHFQRGVGLMGDGTSYRQWRASAQSESHGHASSRRGVTRQGGDFSTPTVAHPRNQL